MLLFYVQSNQIYLCDSLQGAPGNRGFPGQDGLAGAKVGLKWHFDFSSPTYEHFDAQEKSCYGHKTSCNISTVLIPN